MTNSLLHSCVLLLLVTLAHMPNAAAEEKCCVCFDDCVSTITNPQAIIQVPEGYGINEATCEQIWDAAEVKRLIPASLCPKLDQDQFREICGCENYVAPKKGETPVVAPVAVNPPVVANPPIAPVAPPVDPVAPVSPPIAPVAPPAASPTAVPTTANDSNDNPTIAPTTSSGGDGGNNSPVPTFLVSSTSPTADDTTTSNITMMRVLHLQPLVLLGAANLVVILLGVI